MNRKYELQKRIAGLLGNRKMSVETAIMKAGLNYEWISQALQFNAETIYRFRVDNNKENTCDYLSKPLLKHRGTLVYSYIDNFNFSHPDMDHWKELWILDDLTFVVISAVMTTDPDNEFSEVYREVRTQNFDEILREINIIPSKFVAALQALSDAYSAVPMPFQEL